MKRISRIFLVVFFLYLGLFFYASSVYGEIPGQKLRVKLGVEASPSIKGSITNSILRELRSLGGIEIVDGNHEYAIYVTALQWEDTEGEVFGVVISYLFLESFRSEPLNSLLNEKSFKTVDRFTKGLYQFKSLRIQNGSIKDLERFCEEIVSVFNRDVLQKRRKNLPKATGFIEK